MHGRAIGATVVLLVATGLAPGRPLAETGKPAAVKTPLQVTYYYLPG